LCPARHAAERGRKRRHCQRRSPHNLRSGDLRGCPGIPIWRRLASGRRTSAMKSSGSKTWKLRAGQRGRGPIGPCLFWLARTRLCSRIFFFLASRADRHD
jgi:hypothetical protein